MRKLLEIISSPNAQSKLSKVGCHVMCCEKKKKQKKKKQKDPLEKQQTVTDNKIHPIRLQVQTQAPAVSPPHLTSPPPMTK